MNKLTYQSPVCEIVRFETVEIIMASVDNTLFQKSADIGGQQTNWLAEWDITQ